MSGLEALMAGRTDPFGALLPPMAKPPAPGPNPDRVSSGNILTGGVAGGGTAGPPPPTPGLVAPAALPVTPTLTERLVQETPVRGLARRIPIVPPAPPVSDGLADLLGFERQTRPLSPAGPLRPEPRRVQLAESPVFNESERGSEKTQERRAGEERESDRDGAFASVERIGAAATKAIDRIFDTPLGIQRETLGPLVAQSAEERRGIAGLFRTFNEVFIGGGSVAIDGDSG